jgi:hypothetical protein
MLALTHLFGLPDATAVPLVCKVSRGLQDAVIMRDRFEGLRTAPGISIAAAHMECAGPKDPTSANPYLY